MTQEQAPNTPLSPVGASDSAFRTSPERAAVSTRNSKASLVLSFAHDSLTSRSGSGIILTLVGVIITLILTA